MNYMREVAGLIIKKKRNKIDYTFLLVLAFTAFAKNTGQAQHTTIIGKSLYELRTEQITNPAYFPRLEFRPNRIFSIKSLSDDQPPRPFDYQAPMTYKYQDLAFFCRLEVKMEKASKMPVRFRLGSVPYVDYLEGKRKFYN